MSGDVVPFDFEGSAVRSMLIDGEPWWVATDVCRAMCIVSASRTLARLDHDEKGVHTVNTLRGAQQLLTVNEQGIYRLIFTSRRPEAERFKRWLAHEVLPSLRKYGAYSLYGGDFSAMTAMEQSDPPKRLSDRFSEECVRLGFDSPEAFAKAAGWRQNRLFPILTMDQCPKKAEDLWLLIGLGFDLLYVQTGERTPPLRARALLETWSKLPPERRAQLLSGE